jgi:hypothetical protein
MTQALPHRHLSNGMTEVPQGSLEPARASRWLLCGHAQDEWLQLRREARASTYVTGCKFLQSVQRIEMTAGNVYRGGEPPARAHEQNTEGSCALHHPCCPSRLPFFLPGPPWFPGLPSTMGQVCRVDTSENSQPVKSNSAATKRPHAMVPQRWPECTPGPREVLTPRPA